MKIRLSYTGYLKLEGVKNGEIIDIPEGFTVSDVMTKYKIPEQQQRFLKVFLNDQEAKLTQELKSNDDLLLIIQVGGG